MTTYQEHVRRWSDCRLCPLCEVRTKVVLARGTLPADICFVGEAPGVSEDAIGLPFVGPAGHLLDRIIGEAFSGYPKLTWAFTNLVCCFPKEEKEAGTNEPPIKSIKACAERLWEFIEICDPRLIVMVGDLAKRYVTPRYPGMALKNRLISIIHPAAILRANVAMRGLMAQRCVVTLRNAVEDLGLKT